MCLVGRCLIRGDSDSPFSRQSLAAGSFVSRGRCGSGRGKSFGLVRGNTDRSESLRGVRRAQSADVEETGHSLMQVVSVVKNGGEGDHGSASPESVGNIRGRKRDNQWNSVEEDEQSYCTVKFEQVVVFAEKSGSCLYIC